MRTTPIAVLLVAAAPALATDYHLYYLGGQSNMDGFGMVAPVPSTHPTPPTTDHT